MDDNTVFGYLYCMFRTHHGNLLTSCCGYAAMTILLYVHRSEDAY